MGVSSTTRIVGAPDASVAGGDVTGLRSRGEPLDSFEVELIREPGDVVSEADLLGVSQDQFLGNRVQVRDASDRGGLAKPLSDGAERRQAGKFARWLRHQVGGACHFFETDPDMTLEGADELRPPYRLREEFAAAGGER